MQPVITIFGASGDLTSRKLIPALFNLEQAGLLPEATKILGFSRTEMSDEAFREKLCANLEDNDCEAAWEQFSQRIHYMSGDIASDDSFTKLSARIDQFGASHSPLLFYFATAPAFYSQIAARLKRAGLQQAEGRESRLVIEKPFGTDLPSAKKINDAIHQSFDEEQIYRIDHYLGKETVQNLLVFRFANQIFEPLWNRNYIEHVQISAMESLGVGSRAGYYDTSGVFRDMLQSHLMQLLTLITMEPPSRYEAQRVRSEKVKVLEAIHPFCGTSAKEVAAVGQYAGYLDEQGVPEGSTTPTFAAVRLCVDNWRWQGVPFYLRSGKHSSCRTTQVLVTFRKPPIQMFESAFSDAPPNQLLFQIQPSEGISLHFQSKQPGNSFQLRNAELGFHFDELGKRLPEAYERLLLDAIMGDASLFARSDEVELAWKIFDPLIAAWEGSTPPIYQPGEWGPKEAYDWIEQDGRSWFDLCPL